MTTRIVDGVLVSLNRSQRRVENQGLAFGRVHFFDSTRPPRPQLYGNTAIRRDAATRSEP